MAGCLFSGFSEARPNDRFGVACDLCANFRPGARQFDRDVQIFTGTPYPVRDFEAHPRSHLSGSKSGPASWCSRCFQYIVHPGGGAVDPNDPTQTRRIKDAVMLGVRTTVSY